MEEAIPSNSIEQRRDVWNLGEKPLSHYQGDIEVLPLNND